MPQAGGTAIQGVIHAWDAAGNLSIRQDIKNSTAEIFSYDSLDRLTAVDGSYRQDFSYDSIGNITSKDGTSITYGD